MKTTAKIKDWRERSAKTLQQDATDLSEKLRSLRFLASQGKLKNVREIRQIRKDLARIKTIAGQKEKHA